MICPPVTPGRRLLAVALAIGVLVGGAPSARTATTSAPFNDIAGHPFAADIDWLRQAEITSGCGDGRFCPDSLVTREQMASFLVRAFHLPASTTDAFADDEWSMHQASINSLALSGITGGCGSGQFCPLAIVTRGQMASFLSRALSLPAGSRDYFVDDYWSAHQADINRLAESGITSGCAPGRFCPDAGVTRGQMAAFLHRALVPSTRLPPPVAGPPPSLDGRPYTAGSAWNTPIAAGAAADPNSAQLIAGLGQHNGGRITSDPEQYTFPVYFADAATPRYDVPCRVYRCTLVSPAGTSSTDVLQGVPIPAGARPSAGSDGQMIIIDAATGTEWDVWQASFDGSGWSVSNGSVYNVYWDGMPTRYGSRGAGVPYYAGLIRPWEIAAGRIDHALAFAYPAPASGRCVWPASKTDGNTGGDGAIPEGARLQLDPNLTDADFAALGLDRTGQIIARALQQYGMILIDVSGRPKIYAENLVVNPFAAYSWADPAIALSSTTITALPHTAFQVLDLPDGYWTGSGPLHGECRR
jgi:hypothetical protein